jgi:ketosteroid isomerase-like protein
MKKFVFKAGMLLMTGIFAVACDKKDTPPPPPTAPVDEVAIKTQIQTMETAYADAMNKGDASSVVSAYYAEDARSFEQEKKPMEGRKAIEESMKKEMADHHKGGKVAFTTSEVHPSADGNQVLEIGSFEAKDSTGTTKMTGNYFAYFEKRDGKYICIRDMGALDTPKPEKK